jgi:hypothetical protein
MIARERARARPVPSPAPCPRQTVSSPADRPRCAYSSHATAFVRFRPRPDLGSVDPGQGLRLGERSRVGRSDRWASSPCYSFGRPCDLPGLSHAESLYRSVSLSRWFSRTATEIEVRELGVTRWVGRAIGLDVHRDFCVVAVCEDGVVRSAGRVPSTPGGSGLWRSLLRSDRVALEVTGSCWGGGADPRAVRQPGCGGLA